MMNSNSNSVEKTLSFLSIDQANIQVGLQNYFKDIEDVVSKSYIEWHFIEMIVNHNGLKPVNCCPCKALYQRVSGVSLLFIYAQYSNTELEYVYEFNKLMLAPFYMRDYFAYAWSINPNCAFLYNVDFRKKFVRWLSKSDKSIGICLIAEVARSDSIDELIKESSDEWVRRGFCEKNTPQILSTAIQFPSLKGVCQQIVKKCISMFSEDTVALLELMRCAYVLEDYKSAVSYSEIMLNLKADAQTLKVAIPMRISALVELDKETEAAEEYQSLWMPMEWPFPYPDKLLFIFQINGLARLEKHLLDHCVIDGNTADWAKLRWLHHSNRQEQECLLQDWIALYAKQGLKDLRVLYGFSLFLSETTLPNSLTKECTGRIVENWRQYRNHKPYKELASAFLTLLSPTHVELIEAYEAYLAGGELRHPIEKLAAQSYIRALAHRKQWHSLRQFLDQQTVAFIRAISPFGKREFIQNMAVLESLPSNKPSLIAWCRQWERLISLPLDTEMLLQAIEHFVNLGKQLSSEYPDADSNPLCSDVKLQLLRRAKSEAESLLIQAAKSSSDMKDKRDILYRADLEKIHRILHEMLHEFRETSSTYDIL